MMAGRVDCGVVTFSDIESGELRGDSRNLPHHECILCILGGFHAEE